MGFELDLCSPIRLRNGQRVVGDEEVRGRRTRLALAYLVLERGRAVPTHELAAVLWSEGPPPSWPSSVREVISRVRRVLDRLGGDASIVTKDRCLCVTLPADTSVDVEQLVDGRDHAGAGMTTPDGTPGRRFLPGEVGPWVEGWRARIEEAHRNLVTADGRAALERGDAAAAVGMGRLMLQQDPDDDAAADLLMRGLAALGHRAEALRTYERHRRRLADELGIDPSPVLQALHLELLGAGDHVPSTPRTQPRPGRSCPPPVAAAPPDLVLDAEAVATALGIDSCLPLLGRAGVLRRVSEALEEGHPVVVTGESRSGKTRLLAELMADEQMPTSYVRCGLHGTTRMDVAGRARTTVHGAGPRTWLVDDVQWIDDRTHQLVLDAVRSGVRVVATACRDEPTRVLTDFLGELHRSATVRTVELEPISADVMASIVPACGDADHRAQAIHLSGGNVGYLIDLLREPGDPHGPPPESIRTIASSRIDRLPEDAKHLLDVAAVAGDSFLLSRVAPAAGQCAPDDWYPPADALVDHGLLRVVDPEEGLLAFRHPVVRRVVLHEIGPLMAHRHRARLDATNAPPTIHLDRQRVSNGRPTAVS